MLSESASLPLSDTPVVLLTSRSLTVHIPVEKVESVSMSRIEYIPLSSRFDNTAAFIPFEYLTN